MLFLWVPCTVLAAFIKKKKLTDPKVDCQVLTSVYAHVPLVYITLHSAYIPGWPNRKHVHLLIIDFVDCSKQRQLDLPLTEQMRLAKLFVWL